MHKNAEQSHNILSVNESKTFLFVCEIKLIMNVAAKLGYYGYNTS